MKFHDGKEQSSDQGGRLPTEPELRLFFDRFEMSYEEGRNVGFRN
jgi:L-histidine Nalpha-methyltransferase / hercynylcysteine S-oxide synthase